jgi:hypothetical protein
VHELRIGGQRGEVLDVRLEFALLGAAELVPTDDHRMPNDSSSLASMGRLWRLASAWSPSVVGPSLPQFQARSKSVVGRVIQPAVTQRRAGMGTLGGVVEHDIQHLESGGTQGVDHGLELGDLSARVPGPYGDRVDG